MNGDNSFQALKLLSEALALAQQAVARLTVDDNVEKKDNSETVNTDLSQVASRFWKTLLRMTDNTTSVTYSALMRAGHLKADEMGIAIDELCTRGLIQNRGQFVQWTRDKVDTSPL